MYRSNYKKKVVSYSDLDVYQRSYSASVLLIKKILPYLPQEEKYDLKDQLRRSSKAIPRLIAEGFAKKNQTRAFQKYLIDAMGENNETIVGLQQIIDIYSTSFQNTSILEKLLQEYDIIGRQLNNLCKSWNRVKSKDRLLISRLKSNIQ